MGVSYRLNLITKRSSYSLKKIPKTQNFIMKLIVASACAAAVAAVPAGHSKGEKGDHGHDSPSMEMSESMSMSGSKSGHGMMEGMMDGGKGGQMGNNMFVEGTVFINNGMASYGMEMDMDGMKGGKGGKDGMKGGKGGMHMPMGGSEDMMHMKALMHMFESMDIEEEDIHAMMEMKVKQKFGEYQHCRMSIANKIMMEKMNAGEMDEEEDNKNNGKNDKNDKNNNKNDKNNKDRRRRQADDEAEEKDDKKNNNKGDKNNGKNDKNNKDDKDMDGEDHEDMDHDDHDMEHMDHPDMSWLMDAWGMDMEDKKEMMHHMPEMPEQIKEMMMWHSMEDFYEMYGQDIAKMKEEMMESDEAKAMHEMHMSYYIEEKREEVEMMYPYAEHQK